MTRYFGIGTVCGLFLLSVFAIQPINKKRCALEPCMDGIDLKSSSFIKDSKIPTKYVFKQENVYPHCGGKNISPQLNWQPVKDAQSYVIIVQDPDAPSRKNPNPNPFIHWLIYDIPASIIELKEGVISSAIGAKEGINDFGNARYDGPCPPKGSGEHRYYFKILALNITSLGLPVNANKDAIMAAAKDHIIASGELMGIYEVK